MASSVTAPMGSNGDGSSSSGVTSPSFTMSPTATTPRRARHTRTNASLTSGAGSSGSSSAYGAASNPYSSAQGGASLFQATGFDPMRTEPDTLFMSLGVKEVESYERAVRAAALEKQQELRSLVGERYEDLLGTANTIINMSGSSSQLSERLSDLSQNIEELEQKETRSASATIKARRASFLPGGNGLPTDVNSDAELDRQEAVYVLGAVLKLIMDAPEYVWRSIEKGKTLHAAWAYMLTRAAWWDLIEKSPSTATANGSETLSSVTEAVSRLGINVKKSFPFIEKQWQSMIPMRKQIVQRAVGLLADAEIEVSGVADQLATLLLVDGYKLDQAFNLLLAQRQATMKKLLHRKAGSRRRPSVSFSSVKSSGDLSRTPNNASALSELMIELIKLFARTLQHAVQIFIMPAASSTGKTASTRTPLLTTMLTTMIGSANASQDQILAASPAASPSALPESTVNATASRKANAAASRAARRRSSYGLSVPASGGSNGVGSAAGRTSLSEQPEPEPRVSTLAVLQALPSAQLLIRLLPMSVWAFTPYIELEAVSDEYRSRLVEDLQSWSSKVRTSLVTGHGDAAQTKGDSTQVAHSLRALLKDVTDISDLTMLRKTARGALDRVRRIVLKKLTRVNLESQKDSGVIQSVERELLEMRDGIYVILNERLEAVFRQELRKAVQSVLAETRNTLAYITDAAKRNHSDAASAVLTAEQLELSPLQAMFVDTDSIVPADTEDEVLIHTRISRSNPNPMEASGAQLVALENQLLGRTPIIDRIAKLYQQPLAKLVSELDDHVDGMEEDSDDTDKEKDQIGSFRSGFDTYIAEAHHDLHQQLRELVQGQTADTPARAFGSNKQQEQMSPTTSFILRLIACLTSAGTMERNVIRTSLEQHWQPDLEDRILKLLQSNAVPLEGDREDSISVQLMASLTMLSSSVVQFGSSQVRTELSHCVTEVLNRMKDTRSSSSDPCSTQDVRVIEALLSSSSWVDLDREPALRRIKLLLLPLLSLRMNEEGRGKINLSAEPASATKTVVPLVALARKSPREQYEALPIR